MKRYAFLKKRIEDAQRESGIDSSAPICELVRTNIDPDFRGSAKRAILTLCDNIRTEPNNETVGRNGQPKQ